MSLRTLLYFANQNYLLDVCTYIILQNISKLTTKAGFIQGETSGGRPASSLLHLLLQ